MSAYDVLRTCSIFITQAQLASNSLSSMLLKKDKPDLSEAGMGFILNVCEEGVGHRGGGWKERDDLSSS